MNTLYLLIGALLVVVLLGALAWRGVSQWGGDVDRQNEGERLPTEAELAKAVAEREELARQFRKAVRSKKARSDIAARWRTAHKRVSALHGWSPFLTEQQANLAERDIRRAA